MNLRYLDEYYLAHGNDLGISGQSSFADFCLMKFFNDKMYTIVELGSGNGRDSLFFASNGHRVIALDQSRVAVELEKELVSIRSFKETIILKRCDFVKENYAAFGKIDAFYSRFTLHAISKKSEQIILPKIFDSLEENGLFLIEARTTKDSLFGMGEPLEKNAYATDHYRRFVNSDDFLKTVLSLGFKLLYFTEENGFSISNDDDPVLMRIVLRK